jgi:Dullard-like phosphatase family protein
VIAQIRNKKSVYASALPEQREKRRVLVLDLDETLIHTSFNRPAKYDFESEVLFNGKNTRIYTVKRFGLEAFLFEMSRLFEIVVFTASQKMYADKVIDTIDPKGRISHRLYREHCIVINKTYYLKNLKILGRPLTEVIIVDVRLFLARTTTSPACCTPTTSTGSSPSTGTRRTGSSADCPTS